MSSTVPQAPEAGAELDPWASVIRRLTEILAERLRSVGVAVEAEALRGQVDRPTSTGGDLAFPVHRHAKAAGCTPPELASRLATGFPLPAEIATAVAEAGFLNFTANDEWLARATLERALSGDRRFGTAPPTGRSVCVEHTSANPTGPFHIGRVRNGIIGDTLARVLRASGDSVTTQYYVDDVGRQAAMITWIWTRPPADWPPSVRAAVPGSPAPELTAAKPDLALGRPYPAVSAFLKENEAANAEVAELSRRLERGEAPPEHRALGEAILRGMVASLGRIGIRFDEFVWESAFLKDRSVEGVVARLRAAPHATTEANGALAIDTSSYGLPKETAQVIVTRGDGTTLYATRDVAYHLQKFARFERVVDVLGQDHQLHAKTLGALLNEIGEIRRPEFLIYQDITVPEGGRMSSRKGSAVYLDDLLDEAIDRARAEVRTRRQDLPPEELETIAIAVAASAVRYQILRVAPEKTVTFRWEDALSFEGRSGPFLQYSYARASSILRKGGASEGPWNYDAAQLGDPESLALLRVLSRLPGTIAYAARTGHVHTVAGFAHEVAEGFNRFYEKVPVLSADAARSSRLALVAATRGTLGQLLELVGVTPLETM
jgi:arginyl-tRNA synthetase